MSEFMQFLHSCDNGKTFLLLPCEVKRWFFNIFQKATLQLSQEMPKFVKKISTKIHGTVITLLIETVQKNKADFTFHLLL